MVHYVSHFAVWVSHCFEFKSAYLLSNLQSHNCDKPNHQSNQSNLRWCRSVLWSPNESQVRQLLKKKWGSLKYFGAHVYGVAFFHLFGCHLGPETSCGVCGVAYSCANYSTDCQTLAQTQQHLIICVCVCVTVWEMQFVNLKWTIA